ncbi:MAG: MBOAT family O-acyltransferase [Gammaproteobacteria bacterium]|nr:MBOAT family O-acyltransferase [Gammaproteobacteria bacterium]
MLFSSPFFIFIFFPLFLFLFFIAGAKLRDYVLLTGSLGFYLWGEPTFCLIAIASALLDYGLCKIIYRLGVKNNQAKRYVAIGIIANLAILFYYKYTNFMVSSITQLIPGGKYHFEFFDIILPIGVSFIVFEKITYIIDVYRGTGKPAEGIVKYLNYVFLFPKLLAGPIIKYHEIEQQLHHRKNSLDDIGAGFKRFIRGLIKKVLIADTCGEVVNQVFDLPANQLGFSHAWLGIICFTLQIYFDFSGYSDMALGIAKMLGFRLRENFNLPYIATSFTDFWRRWHISLSTWIREYLYIPLGGSRVTQTRMYLNLWICFLLSGLWHGANWTFVLWGAYNGLFLVLDKVFWLKASDRLPSLFRAVLTLFFVMIGWVIFRSSNFDQIHYYLKTLINPMQSGHAYIDITPDIMLSILVGSTLALAALLPGYANISRVYANWHWRFSLESVVFSVFGFFCICKIVGVSFNPFLYFRF